MYKYFLTYQLASRFEQECRRLLHLEAPTRSELLRCAQAVLIHVRRAVQTNDPKDESLALYVAITYLRDCNEMLEKSGGAPDGWKGPFELIHARLEDHILKAAGAEGGQLRMLG